MCVCVCVCVCVVLLPHSPFPPLPLRILGKCQLLNAVAIFPRKKSRSYSSPPPFPGKVIRELVGFDGRGRGRGGGGRWREVKRVFGYFLFDGGRLRTCFVLCGIFSPSSGAERCLGVGEGPFRWGEVDQVTTPHC